MNLKTIWGVLATVLLFAPAYADDEEKAEDEEETPKTIADLTEGYTRMDGLVTLFRNEETGELKLLVPGDLIGNEVIHVAQASDGVVQIGYFRGAYLAEQILSFERRFDKLDIVIPNTSFYFDPDNALARASTANTSNAILATEKVLAEGDEGVLINADKLFKSESLLQIKPSPNPDANPRAYSLGSLSDSSTRVSNLRSYPNNTDIEVTYVYSNPSPTGRTGGAIADRRHVEIPVMHSFVRMPDNGYEPRLDDPRVGYFMTQVTDLTSFSATPYRDMIHRWHLVKQDPTAPVSDPVEPITLWIENTTPLEYRDMIRDAALQWNTSFAKAGFSNAVQVKVQPDDAEWDAGDVRYNVLRWTSSPNPPFGGYGPSFTNPRTGQIIGADIMLEYSFLGRFQFAKYIVSDASTLVEDFSVPEGLAAAEAFCSLGAGLRAETHLAHTLGRALHGDNGKYDEQLVHDSMYYLILHEIGHTLGLNHNMKATQLLSPQEAFDPAVMNDGVLAGSVMDYPAVNFAPIGTDQTLFYTVAPGPYDDWAIQFGYDPELNDPEKMAEHLSRSNEPELAFGNDADDMRSPGKAIDPRVNIYDMSNDAVGYASDRMALIVKGFTQLAELPPEDGKSWQETHDAFGTLIRSWARSGAVVSRYVGGVMLNRGMVGQPGSEAPYTVVDADTQRRAMSILSEQLFAPGIVDPAAPVFRYLAQQRRGFNFFSGTEDPKIHDAVLAVQGGVLNHLLHPATMKRMTDTSLYGNDYMLADMVGDLTDAVFEADIRGDVDTIRQGLQIDYVRRLAAISSPTGGYDTTSQSAAVYALQNIERMMSRKRGGSASTRAHVAHLGLLIERALSTD
ncbi:MAG: zinc-dependent metalloprotease [Pseudomonadota bacterium]